MYTHTQVHTFHIYIHILHPQSVHRQTYTYTRHIHETCEHTLTHKDGEENKEIGLKSTGVPSLLPCFYPSSTDTGQTYIGPRGPIHKADKEPWSSSLSRRRTIVMSAQVSLGVSRRVVLLNVPGA